MSAAAPPDRIDNYTIVRELPGGGMGTVYLARDEQLDRPVVLKLLRESLEGEEMQERFVQEARSAAKLRHPNIVTVYGFGLHEGRRYIAMEFVEGKSLHELIAKRAPLPLADKLSYLEQVCAGLHHAHAAGIVHRDIKPANIMVDGTGVVRILDFGIAHVAGSTLTVVGSTMGTLNYMSPQQMRGEPTDLRTDVFSVGAVAYELVAYQKAFPGSERDGLLHRLLHEPPRPLAELCEGLPDHLPPAILRALEKEPDDRFPDLDAFRLVLERIRREIDPALEPTLFVPARPGEARGSTARPATPASPGTRPLATPPPGATRLTDGHALAVTRHLDVARTAFGNRDLHAAAAACDAALTLDADNVEALRLRADVERTNRLEQSRRSKRTLLWAGGGLAAVAVIVWFAMGSRGPGTGETPPSAADGRIVRAPDVPEPMGPAPVSPAPAALPPATPVAPATPPTAGGTPGPSPPAPSATIPPAGGRTPPPAVTTVTPPVRAPEVPPPSPTRAAEPPPVSAQPAPPPVVPTTPAPAPTVAAPAPPPAAAPAPAAATPPPVAPAPVVPPPRVSPLDAERSGILAALNRFQDAYRSMSVDAIRKVYPSFGREDGQRLERQFRNCRAYDVALTGMNPSMGDDPELATVEARATYTCTPRTGQAPLSSTSTDVFRLRKFGGAWIIDRVGSLQ